MSQRIRGQEAKISILVTDEFLQAFGLTGQLEGSFTKVKDFKSSPRMEQTEEGYVGENADDLDQQLNGWDFSFTIDELDSSALDLFQLIAHKEKNKLRAPEIVIQVTYAYRDERTLPRTEIFMGCILKMSERNIGGRKEYISNSFEGKAKDMQLVVG